MTTFYLDLDRTLFRTDKVDELFAAIAAAYPHNTHISQGYNDRERYYVLPFKAQGDTATYYHDTAKQLREIGVDPNEAFVKIQPLVGDGRFEYPGVPQLIHDLRGLGSVKILTFGEDSYQRAKAALCPSLRTVAVVTIIEPKAEWLNKHAQEGDWIVDDRILEGVKSGVHTLHIQHDKASKADVHSLPEAQEYIHHTIDTKA